VVERRPCVVYRLRSLEEDYKNRHATVKFYLCAPRPVGIVKNHIFYNTCGIQTQTAAAAPSCIANTANSQNKPFEEFPTYQFRTMAAAQTLEDPSTLEERAKERQTLFVKASIEKFNDAHTIYSAAYLDPKEAKKKNSKIYQTAGGAVESGVAELLKFVPAHC